MFYFRLEESRESHSKMCMILRRKTKNEKEFQTIVIRKLQETHDELKRNINVRI